MRVGDLVEIYQKNWHIDEVISCGVLLEQLDCGWWKVLSTEDGKIETIYYERMKVVNEYKNRR